MPNRKKDPGSAVKETLWRRDFILVFLANVAVFAGFQMVNPTMPLYIELLGGGQTIMGIVVGIFTFSAVAARPSAGWALDSLGRKGVLLPGLVVLIASSLAYRWVPSIGVLLPLRFVHGLGWGFYTTAVGTVVADMVPRSRLGEGMGFFGMSSTLSIALAPGLGLFLINHFSFPHLFFTSASLATLGLALALAIAFRNPPRNPGPGQGEGASRRRLSLIESRALWPSLVILFSNTTLGAIITFLVPYAMQRGIPNIGVFFTVYAASLALSRPLAGTLGDRRGFGIVIVPSLALTAGALIVLSQAQELWMFLVVAVLYGVGFGAIPTSLQALVVRDMPSNRIGAATGTFYSGFDLGIGLGAVLWGAVSQATGYSVMYLLATAPVGFAIVTYLLTTRARRACPGTLPKVEIPR